MPLTLIVEGINGAGKSTFIKALKKKLKGIKVRAIKFPSSTHTQISDTPEGKVLSYIADFETVMTKELNRPLAEVYLIDRGFVSTAVYKGGEFDAATLQMGASALLKVGGTVIIVQITCLPHVAASRLFSREVEASKDVFGGIHNSDEATQEELATALMMDSDRFDNMCKFACTLELHTRCMLTQPIKLMQVDTTDGDVNHTTSQLAKGIQNYLKKGEQDE